MRHEDLENKLLEGFKTKPNFRGLKEGTGIEIGKLIKLYKILRSNRETSYNEWIRELLPLTDKRTKYYSKKLDLEFVVLDCGTVIMKDWTTYLKYEWEKLKGLTNDELRSIHQAKEVFNNSTIIK